MRCQLYRSTRGCSSRISEEAFEADVKQPNKFGPESLREVQADAIYFMMWGGWKGELRSNRWHFAKQWSRYLPVVMLQPELEVGKPARSEFVNGIENCRLLYIRTSRWGADTWTDADQIDQIYSDMKSKNIRRPIFWLYNPYLAAAFASIPAVARVIHATESYFDWADMEPAFLNRLRLCGEIADLIIPVSEGVQACYRSNIPHAKYYLLTNGCDYNSYSSGKQDGIVLALKRQFHRVAIYAGNINERLDYGLIWSCAQSAPHTCFVFFGPVSFLPNEDAVLWESVVELPNVRYMGAVNPDRIPDLYAAADVGVIPYKDTINIRESGFALKALEMLAAGLPVVSTMMRPLVGVSNELHVNEQSSEFVSVLSRVDRRHLSPSQQQGMREVSLRYDYEERFPLALAAIKDAVGSAPALRIRLKEFVQALATGELGIVIEPERVWPDFDGNVPSYLGNLTKALRTDRSMQEFLLRKIRSSSAALALHRFLRSSPAATAVLRSIRDRFLRLSR